MATGNHEAAGSSSTSARPPSVVASTAGDQTYDSTHFRNGVTSPGTPGSEADSTINNTSFAPSILASRLGRGIYSSAGAAGSIVSLSGSGFNSPSLNLTGFNAISTVLNNPSKRQHPIDPKSSRFPAVTPNHVSAEIPKVKKSELDPYLSSVRPEWDRFMRNQSMGRQGKATIEQQQQQQSPSTQDAFYASEPLGKHGARHRPNASIANLSVDLQAVPPPPQPRKRLPNLSAVPQVFFAEDFDLGNPYTFDQVTERYKVASASPADQNGSSNPTYDVALNQMLQEKLSYYSDVIEQHLIIEIGQQSSSFFAALENLNDLNAEAESCLLKIDELKSDLESIDEQQARRGLQVIREQQHRRQLERKQIAVRDVRQVIERRDLVRLLLQQGETEEALDLLDKLRSTLRRAENDQAPSPTDGDSAPRAVNPAVATESGITLSDLKGLTDIPAQLEEMEQTLSGMLEQDLVTALISNIDGRLRSFQEGRSSPSSSAETEKDSRSIGGANGSTPSYLHPNVARTESLLTPSQRPPSPFGHSARTLSFDDSELASRIAPLVIGLAKTGGIEKAVSVYRDVAIQAVQEAWRATLSQSSTDMAESVQWLLTEDLSKLDGHDNLPPPAARIRDLEHATFLDMCRQLFDTLGDCLKVIDAQCQLVPRILDDLAARSRVTGGVSIESGRKSKDDGAQERASSGFPLPPTMPPGVPINLPAKLSDVVAAAAEQAHGLSARLLSLRATTHAALELPQFLVVFQLCWTFVLSSEQLCRKMIVGLRGTILGQAKGFLANFHRRRIERAAKAVEEETWAQADVGAEIQDQIRQIVNSAVEDPANFVVASGADQIDAGDGKDVSAVRDASAADDVLTAAKTLDIEGRPYFVVEASLDVLALLVDYLKVIINLPLLTTEAMARVVEFLKQFNSRTCQVVLGAGAMRSAGLKNITAKHLALASQSLSVMIALIPYIRETVRRHLSPKQAVMLTEFDKLRRDFQEHQYEIHAKLVAIMSDRLTVHCRTLSSIDWNADKAAADGQDDDVSKDVEPNKYATDLVKETATLHKVLSKYLQGVVVEHIIGQVLRAIDERIANEFDRLDVRNEHALDRMRSDVRFLGTKLSGLKHVEWKDEALQQVLASKHVATPSSANTMGTAGSSAANNEIPRGSPALDKTATSTFGPVTYKPRIPNIFARRQQQQHQQQQSQSNSPRASTDVPAASRPVEAQRFAEAAPQNSLQIQPEEPQLETGTPVTGDLHQANESALRPPETSASSVARGIEEEVNDAPPAPPSKGEEAPSPVIVTDEDGDAEVTEDLVAPVVPAPEAVARLFGENASTDPDATAVAASDADATAAATEAEGTAASSQAFELQSEQDAAANSVEQHEELKADAVASNAEADKAATEAARDAPKDRVFVQANDATPVASDASPDVNPQLISTPQKDARGFNASLALSSVIGTPSEASPTRSGASTPALPATPKTPTSATPSKPGRMSLKERLAEAARKRAQQSAPQASGPVSTAAPVPAEQPASEEKNDVADPVAATPAEVHESPVEIHAASQTAAASGATISAPGQAVETSVEKDADEANPTARDNESAALEHRADSEHDADVSTDKKEEAAHAEASLKETAPEDVAAEATASAVSETTEEAVQKSTEDVAAAESGSTDVDAAVVTVNATDAGREASKDVEPAAGSNGEQHGDGEDAIEGDGDADADTNEGTHESTVGGGSGAGGKKTKKKKKKGKKK